MRQNGKVHQMNYPSREFYATYEKGNLLGYILEIQNIIVLLTNSLIKGVLIVNL